MSDLTVIDSDVVPGVIRHVIVDGPTSGSIWNDADERRTNPKGKHSPLKFVTGSDVNLLCLNITDAERVAGSGTPLSIQGHMSSGELFKGHYNAHTRSGYIDIITS